MKTYLDTQTCTQMFIAALFITSQKRKQGKCLPTDERINKIWWVYPYDELLSGHKKEMKHDSCYNMDEP